jgi:hypothetical protein
VKLVTITFPGDPRENDVVSFGDWVIGSSWLATVGAEYGVAGGAHTHVLLDQPAPAAIGDAGIATLLAGLVDTGTLPSGSGDWLYTIVFPPTTTITDLAFGCATNGDADTSAWHESYDDGKRAFAYAVVPTCTKESAASLGVGLSHELIEAMTDAFPLTKPAYQFPATATYHFALGEVGDLCEGLVPYEDPAGFTVTRVWSNLAAGAGQWPCVPAPKTPYANLAPAKDEILHAKPGSTLEVDLQAFSSDASGSFSWTVGAMPFDAQAKASLDRSFVKAGEVAKLTVTLDPGAFGTTDSPVVVYVTSRTAAGFVGWPIVIVTD